MINRIKIGFIIISVLIISLFAPLTVYANSDVSILLELDKTQITTSEAVTLKVKVYRSDINGNISLSPIDIAGLESFSVQSNSSSNSVNVINGVGQTMSEIQIVISTNEVGSYTIGPAKVSYTDPNTGQNKTLSSNTENLEVKKQVDRIIQESTENKSIQTSDNDSSLLEFIISFIIFVVIVAAGIFLFWYQKNRNKFLIENVVSNEEALKLPNTTSEVFLDRAYDLVREYLKRNTEIHTDQTTSDILKELKKNKYYKYDLVQEILHECDLRRYAKKSEGNEEVLEMLKRLVG